MRRMGSVGSASSADSVARVIRAVQPQIDEYLAVCGRRDTYGNTRLGPIREAWRVLMFHVEEEASNDSALVKQVTEEIIDQIKA